MHAYLLLPVCAEEAKADLAIVETGKRENGKRSDFEGLGRPNALCILALPPPRAFGRTPTTPMQSITQNDHVHECKHL